MEAMKSDETGKVEKLNTCFELLKTGFKNGLIKICGRQPLTQPSMSDIDLEEVKRVRRSSKL